MVRTSDEGAARYRRKTLLGRVGAGAAAAGTSGLLGADGAEAAPHGQRVYAASAGYFGRIFDRLPAFAPQSPRVEAALRDLGKPGGILDARDALEKGPVLLITDPTLSANNPNNPEQTAGIDVRRPVPRPRHDVRRRLAAGRRRRSRGRPSNARTPAFDLDSVYGGGPVASPHLYDSADRAKLRIESGGSSRTCPAHSRRHGDHRRPSQRRARDHRRPAVRVHPLPQQRGRPGCGTAGAPDPFAAGAATHHLALPVARSSTRSCRSSSARRWSTTCSAGAGASTGRRAAPSCRSSSRARPTASGTAWCGRPTGRTWRATAASRSSADLRSRRARVAIRSICAAAAARRVASSAGRPSSTSATGRCKPNKLIDTKISTPLFDLPLGAIASGDPPTSLPQRNLLRQLTWKLPSGQRIAKEMGAPPLAPADLGELTAYGLGLERIDAPLVLRAQGGRGDGRRADTSGRSAAVSLPR